MSIEHGQLPVHATLSGPDGARTIVVPARVESTPVGRGAGGEGAAASPVGFGDILRIVHRALRGAYPLAITLAIIFAVAGAFAGWKIGRPEYHSEGLLRIAYTMPEVLQETDQNRPMAMFDTYMVSQRLLITSRRVIDLAVQDPIWKATNRQIPETPDKYFSEHLDVDIKPRSEFILIKVEDEDPGTAAAAVTAVTNAYVDVFNSQEKSLERQRSGVIEDKKTFLQGQIAQQMSQIRKLSQDFGTENLDIFYQAASQRVLKLETALEDVKVAIATGAPLAVPTTAPTTQPGAGAVAAAAEFTPEQIASAGDAEMGRLLREHAARAAEIEHLHAMGIGPSHPQMQAADFEANQAQKRIEEYARAVHDFRKITGNELSSPVLARAITTGKTLDELQADESRLQQLHDDAKTEMVRIGNEGLELQRLQQDLKSMQEELAELTKRSGVLRAESSLGGRLSVISSGEIPLSPDRNSRLKFVPAGVALGALLPFSVIAAVGLLRRRYDYSDETEDISQAAPLLGVVPDLEEGDDKEQAAAAARSVHQIRVLLRTRARGRASSVYLMTSATAKEGKTSLTVSLGLSFAAAGLRTLVVDCDLVGQNLTKRFDAGKSGGLYDALGDGSIQKKIRRADGGIYVLTVGNVRSRDAHALPASKLAQLISEARSYFEVVLIDTGPILGSIEASTLAPEVDEAILTVSRGQDRWLVQNALGRLRSLGAAAAGFVYNRAQFRDFHSSPYGSASYSFTSSPTQKASDAETASNEQSQADLARAELKLDGFGPLVKAMGSEFGSGWKN
jgi:Mrp family chromosome partitioning ATPase/uncharacterized protein involved in exopolysaccharide biosynthesis